MYDELVKALRGCVLSKPCDGCPYYDPNGPTEKCATMNIAAADAIEELSKPKWIPVTERLPDDDETVLTWGDLQVVMMDWRHDNKWCCFGDVTHWMPLPQPPEEEGE